MVPTPDEIRVATDALRADAETWSRSSVELGSTAATAEALTVAPEAFSFAAPAAAASHEALRVKAAALLREGSTNFNDIARALRIAADAYEADEAANLHMIRGMY